MANNMKDRKFMEIALKEMCKSRGEHTNKVDPMVGAVLVSSNGNVLEKTHRGSLRVGDHAEYTLIERLLGNENLEGSTLYVTLEPCTVRMPPKKSCVERIVSARIGRVVIGMPDPNPEIQGRGITYLLNNNIKVDFFNLDLVEQIREENKEFIKHYDEVIKKSTAPREEYEGPSEKEKEPVPSATLDDLSTQVIQKYLNSRGKAFRVPSPELWTFFHKNGFLVAHGGKGTYIPTIAGLLLFGKNPEDFLVQSKVKIEAQVGEKLVADTITGPLLLLPHKVEEFFIKNMRSFTEIRRFERIKIPEYPIEALREAVINAIVHRDYKEGTRVIIQILRETISVKSPGLLLLPLSLDKIRAYNAPPFSRNPRIAATFSDIGLMEERGWGLRRMRDLLISHGLRLPDFNYEAGYFVVTFFGYEHAPSTIRIEPDLRAKLSKTEKELLDLILTSGRVTSSECAEHFKISNRAVRRHLNKLEEIGIIERKGSGKATHYILIG